MPTPLHGAYTIELEKRGDDRGFFARFFCQKEFEAAGVPMPIVQINNSLSAKAGTLRGMHYQLAPAAEIKVVRCIRGALYDAIVDLRPDSPTFGKWFGVELTAENRLMMFVPQGFAHGIMTLTDDTEAFYLVNAFYAPETGARLSLRRSAIWHRVADGRRLKFRPRIASWPDFDPVFHGVESLARPDVRILLTGGSSFTGLWFARSLAARGHTVLRRSGASDYSGLRGERVAELAPCCRSHRGLSVRLGSLSRSRWHGLMGSAVPACGADRRLPQSGLRRHLAPSPTTRTNRGRCPEEDAGRAVWQASC